MRCSRILITGGLGFIGSHMMDRLVALGKDVYVIDNLSTGKAQYLNQKLKYWSYQDVGKHPFPEVDLIIHLAALARIQPSFANPSQTYDANSKATFFALEEARRLKCPLIYAGSSSCYDDIHKNPYTYTKWLGEQHCQMYRKVYGVRTAIARFFNVFGPRQIDTGPFATVVGIFERQYRAGELLTITGTGEQRRDFCLTGESRVLMADLTWRAIKDIREGDMVVSFGTPGPDKKRKYGINKVVATMNYISDDVHLIQTPEGSVRATGNHPWLNRRGTFTNTDMLVKKRSQLRLISEPVSFSYNSEYRRGYLCGTLDGDGYLYKDKAGTYRSGLEVTDACFLGRFLGYAAAEGIDLQEDACQPAYKGAKECHRARAWNKAVYESFRKIQGEADFASGEFCRGWLAGIFDSEGERMKERCLRISNKDALVADRIRCCLTKFGFRWSEKLRKDGLVIFAVLGGLASHIRFFATFQPEIQRKRPGLTIREVKGKMVMPTAVTRCDPERVYSIEVENDHTYVAEGFLCHNTHVSDIVGGIEAIMGADFSEGKPYQLGTGENFSINEVADMFPGASKIYIPERPGEAWSTLAEVQETHRRLGWKPNRRLPEYVKGLFTQPQ